MPFGVGWEFVGNMSLVATFTIFKANFIPTALVARFKKVKAPLVIFFCLTTVGVFLIGILVTFENYWVCFVTVVTLFSLGSATLPTVYEFLAEISSPVTEEISSTLFSLRL